MVKYSGEIKYKTSFLYTIYSSPLDEEREEVFGIFNNRWRNGERCFGMGEDYAKHIVYSGHSSIFIVVHEKDTEDYASATINIKNHCKMNKDNQAFIMDLCRHGIKSSTLSPVNVLFDIIGQFLLQKFKIQKLYLNPQPGKGMDKLIEVYQKYGFRKAKCPGNKYFTMRKKIKKSQRKFFASKKNVF